MISFEWLEFETLSRESVNLEDRLRAARSTKNYGQIRLIEPQLKDVNERRSRALEAITRKTASTAAISPPRPASTKRPVAVLVEEKPEIPAATSSTEPEGEPAGGDAPSPAFSRFAGPTEGDRIVWEQLTPEHIELAKRELARRRAETLARHAEELKALETEQDDIADLDRAISAFTRKFNMPAETAAEVVQIEEERQRIAVPA